MFQKPKGTRDFYPDEKLARHVLFDKFRAKAKSYGYKEIETPVFEYLDFLTEKSGDSIKEEIFIFEQRSKEKFGLRFDLTVPAARLFIQKQKELPKPVKWFYVEKLWRYERPQAGRLREFYQMGVELFGSNSPEADAEVIAVAIDFLMDLGLKKNQFVVKINNRKLIEGLLNGLNIKNQQEVIRLIDKSEKIGKEAFTASLKILQLTSKQINDINKILSQKDPSELRSLNFFNRQAEEGLKEMETVTKALKIIGKDGYVQFDLATARGLDYYTGTVFECFQATGLKAMGSKVAARFSSKENLRSIFAGGRYNNLIENFGGTPTPATGFAIGDATLQILLEENGLWDIPTGKLDYSIIIVDEKSKSKAFKLCQTLRNKYTVDIDLTDRSLKQQVSYAEKTAKKAIFIGDIEIKSGKATVKDFRTGKESKVSFNRL